MLFFLSKTKVHSTSKSKFLSFSKTFKIRINIHVNIVDLYLFSGHRLFFFLIRFLRNELSDELEKNSGKAKKSNKNSQADSRPEDDVLSSSFWKMYLSFLISESVFPDSSLWLTVLTFYKNLQALKVKDIIESYFQNRKVIFLVTLFNVFFRGFFLIVYGVISNRVI